MKKIKASVLTAVFLLTSFVPNTNYANTIKGFKTTNNLPKTESNLKASKLVSGETKKNTNLSATNNVNTANANNAEHATGAKPLTSEDKQWIKDNMIDTKNVALNKIGLERINGVRAKKGLKPIDASSAVKIGNEVTSSSIQGLMAVGTSSTDNIPEAVDNSELQYFPPISSQGGIGSCASFSTTYYQATYMNALVKGINVKDNPDDSNVFSTKWTYNLINSGKDTGSSQINAYKLFKEQGIATQHDFPYPNSILNPNPQDYLEWPTNPVAWINAANTRADKYGTVQIGDDSDTTPVNNGVNSSNLNNVKQMLNDGYILNFTAHMGDWSEYPMAKIKNNPYSTNDDKYIGQDAIYESFDEGLGNDLHAVTVVGYNDDIWVDINKNGIMDPGENGAFKVANSWNYFGNNGFIWVCYDALNKASSLTKPPADTPSGYSRTGYFCNNQLYWMTIKNSNTPKLLVQVDMNTSHRDQLKYELGYSETTGSQITWEPEILNMGEGSYSFDGTSTASDGTIVLDYSNFLNQNLSNTSKKWYIKITDNTSDGNSTSIKGFKFIDPSCGTPNVSSTSYDYKINGNKVALDSNYKLSAADCVNIDGNSVTLSVDYTLNSNITQNSQWSFKNSISSNYDNISKMINYNDNIYIICRDKATAIYKIMKYNQTSDSWDIYDSNPCPELYDNICLINSKIYGFDSNNTLCTYDIPTKQWNQDSTFSIPDSDCNLELFNLTTMNNKLYIIGGRKYNMNPPYGYLMNNSVYEYDPETKVWATKANMDYSITDPIVSVAKDPLDNNKEKMYVFGGVDSDGKFLSALDIYDSELNTWTKQTSNLNLDYSFYSLDSIYHYSSYGSYATLNGRIYFCTSGGKTYEYNIDTNTWTNKESIPCGFNGTKSIQLLNGLIYVLDYNNKLYQFNPSFSEKLPNPSLSIASGTCKYKQKLLISAEDPDCVIRYTTDGTTPSEFSTIYSGPIILHDNMTVKAIAMKDGCITSDVTQGNYTAPSFVGDVNGDGVIDDTDCSLMSNYINGIITDFSGIGDDMWAGDLNGDGVINNTDYSLLDSYVKGSIKLFPKEQPTAPTNLTATAIDVGDLKLSWEASNGLSDISLYIIYRNGSPICSTSDTTFLDANLSSNTQYSYTVAAVDADGRKSNLSNSAQVSFPPLIITNQTFDNNIPSDISINVDAYRLTGIYNGTTPLTLGIDYNYEADRYYILLKKSYLKTLPSGKNILTFKFNDNTSINLTINVIAKVTLSPSTATFDLSSPSDVTVSIEDTNKSANPITEVDNGYYRLVPCTDEAVTPTTNGYSCTIYQSYLKNLPIGANTITFKLLDNASINLTINVVSKTVVFDLSSPSNVTVAIADTNKSANPMTGVYNGDYKLVPCTDEAVTPAENGYTDGYNCTIYQSYLKNLPIGANIITFKFLDGTTLTLTINVIKSDMTLSPTTALFSKASPADVTVAITAPSKSTNPITGVYNGDYKLVPCTDEAVTSTTNGYSCTIYQSYLNNLPVGINTITFKFKNGAVMNFTINVINSNMTLSPAAVTFTKASPANITVAITAPNKSTNPATGVYNGTYKLVPGTDEAVTSTTDGYSCTINQSYLNNLPIGTNTITYKFTNGDILNLTVNVQ